MPDSTNTPALPELDPTMGDRSEAERRLNEDDSHSPAVPALDYLTVIVVRERQLSEACKERDELRVSNHRLSRERDRLFSRRIIDSGAKVWLPYWRACKRWVKELQQRAEKAEAELTEARTLLANQAAEIATLREKDA